MTNTVLMLALASVVTAAMADEPVVVKDTRAFACGQPAGSVGKCAAGEPRVAVSGELTMRSSDGFCERHSYGIGGGKVLRSDDGLSQIQLPVQTDRTVNFRCDSHGNEV